jgi:phosphatidylinositol-3-phosphatase
MDRATAITQRQPPDRWRLLAAGVAVATAILVFAVGLFLSRLPTPVRLEPIPAGSVVSVPATQPVIVIVFENQDESTIADPESLPYYHSLVAQGALSHDYQGIAHPSQPNYFALFSGSTQDVTDNHLHDITAPTIADQLDEAGMTWRVFAENYPGDCFLGEEASDGPDGPGNYVRKHVPALSFTGITGSPERCANVQPLRDFDPAAADLIWVVPNLCHDTHDCPVEQGDAWLESFVPRILESSAFQPGGNGVLYITFDEGHGDSVGNEVLTLAVGPNVKAAMRTAVAHNHYSLLRTIEEGLGLPCLANACDANTLGEIFQP